MVERISYRVEEHYSMDAEHPRLGARYRVDEMDKELFLFAYLPDEYAVDDVELGLDQLDRTANAAASIAIQAVAAERERLFEAFSPVYDLMYIKEGVDWHCRICGGYNYTKETVAHGMACPMGKAQRAIRVRAGEGGDGA